jgi:hypothetical protein
MEKTNIEKDDDAINAELFGNDIRVDYNIKSHKINDFKVNLEKMICNARTIEDLNAIGLKLNYAIDNKLDICVVDYQFKAAKKMTEIYKNLETEVKE